MRLSACKADALPLSYGPLPLICFTMLVVNIRHYQLIFILLRTLLSQLVPNTGIAPGHNLQQQIKTI